MMTLRVPTYLDPDRQRYALESVGQPLSALGKILAAALAAAASVIAQPVPHTRTEPKAFTGAFAPTGNFLPLARTSGFLQTWYRGDSMPRPHVVQEIGWRMDPLAVSVGVSHNLEVVIGNTRKTFGTLETIFANNLGPSPTTFVALRHVAFPAWSSAVDPDAPSLWIPGDVPFVFTGPHLIVQVDVRGSSVPRSLGYWVNAYTMTPTSIVHATSGVSCGGDLGATLYTNHVYDLELRNAPPGVSAWFLIGDEQTRLAGGTALPFDLTALGMPGCRLGVDPLLALPAMTTSLGAARARLTLPPLSPSYSVVHVQAAHGASNPLGLATTKVLHAVLGHAEVSNYLYCWDQFGPRAQYGPYPENQGAMLLIRP